MIKPTHNEDDYKDALRQIEALMDARENTPEGDRLDVLATLVETYEGKAFPLDLPDPVEAIKFYMEQNDPQPPWTVRHSGGKPDQGINHHLKTEPHQRRPPCGLWNVSLLILAKCCALPPSP